MKQLFASFLFFACALCANTNAQETSVLSNASFMKPGPRANTIVPYRITDEGIPTPIEWGMDLAWASQENLRIGVSFAGKEVVDIIRLSFQPTYSIEGGSFNNNQIRSLNNRINYVKRWCKEGIGYNINCDHPSLDPWYDDQTQSSDERALRWVQLIDKTADYYKANGLTNLVSISPLNEPDYEWHPLTTYAHRKADFKSMCKIFKEYPEYKDKYANVRMCGGNTLNDDQAYSWWSYMKPYIDEGNTHQLAGSFANYASFFEKVRQADNHATNDELHNVMEAMVGVEYGMQTGIWWGTAEHTRGQFMKATWQGNPGKRLGYAEHRTNWTAASVYRHANGMVQGFGGSSERQAIKTTFQFLALDRPVFYAGQRGREYAMTIDGPEVGGYQNGQTNGEDLIDIQTGEDIMPYVGPGTYKIMSEGSGLILGFTSTPSGWVQATLQNNSADKFRQWTVKPTGREGDFAYITLSLASNTRVQLDIYNFGYNNGTAVGGYPQGGNPGTNEQWYLEYAGHGAFYIRTRHSAKCLEVKNSGKSVGSTVQISDFVGDVKQKWRFVSTEGTPDFIAPAAPTNLTATAQSASVRLDWDAVEEADMKSYTVLRSDDGGEFYTLATEVKGNAFIDNEAEAGVNYIYKVYAEDKWFNRSETVTSASIMYNAEKTLLTDLSLAENLLDATENGNHGALAGELTIKTTKEQTGVALNGTDNYIQLPYTVANSDEITISTWIYYRGGTQWSRIFDFGSAMDKTMYLTPSCGSGMRFVIKNGSDEQYLQTSALSVLRWHHIALTMGADGVKLYVDGVLKKESDVITLRPSDINPIMNYIGRSQSYADPLLKADIHDFQIYNYVLTEGEISDMATGINNIESTSKKNAHNNMYDLSGRKVANKKSGIIIQNNKKVAHK